MITLGSENASSLKQLVKAVNTQYMEIEMEMFGDGVIEAEEKLSALAMQSLETLVRWYSMRDPTKSMMHGNEVMISLALISLRIHIERAQQCGHLSPRL